MRGIYINADSPHHTGNVRGAEEKVPRKADTLHKNTTNTRPGSAIFLSSIGQGCDTGWVYQILLL